jgi:hypothetical protein
MIAFETELPFTFPFAEISDLFWKLEYINYDTAVVSSKSLERTWGFTTCEGLRKVSPTVCAGRPEAGGGLESRLCGGDFGGAETSIGEGGRASLVAATGALGMGAGAGVGTLGGGSGARTGEILVASSTLFTWSSANWHTSVMSSAVGPGSRLP